MDFERQREIETRLRESLEQTKAVYQGAKEEFDRATERANDLSLTHPDGSVRHATRVYVYTQRMFRRALVEFNRFVLDRKLPPK